MSTLTILVGGLAALLVLIGVIIVVQKLTFAALRGPLAARVAARYPDAQQIRHVDYTAMSFGLASAGVTQARGNGAVVVTPDEVRWFQYLPQRETAIPLASIEKLDFVRSHLGKATPYRLVRIQFAGPTGSDTIALFARRPDELRARIDQARELRAAG